MGAVNGPHSCRHARRNGFCVDGNLTGCRILHRDLEALRQKWHGFHESPPPLPAPLPGAVAGAADPRAQQPSSGYRDRHALQQQQQQMEVLYSGGSAFHMDVSPSAGHMTLPARTVVHLNSLSADTRGGTAPSWEAQAPALASAPAGQGDLQGVPMSAASRGGSMGTAAGFHGPPMSAETRGAASTLSPLSEGGLAIGTPVDLLMPASLAAAAFLPAYAHEMRSQQGFLQSDICSSGQHPVSKHPRLVLEAVSDRESACLWALQCPGQVFGPCNQEDERILYLLASLNPTSAYAMPQADWSLVKLVVQ